MDEALDDEATQDQPSELSEKEPRAESPDGEAATARRRIEPVANDLGAFLGSEDSDLVQTVAMAAQPTPQKAESGTPTPQDTPGGSSDPIVQQGQFGKYQIIKRIGAGGFGKVYLGRDPVLGRDVAVKTCTSEDESLRRRFLREAKIAAGLQHPNIVTVYDFGYEGEIPYMVQEYLDGKDLAEKIGREDLSLEVKIDYLLRIARGLAHAHAHDVLHRDIKPANIRVLADGQVRILDFGIARLLNESTAFTTDGITLGTVGYLAPEILNSDDVDARSDIFSFGVVAYELLSHQRPFTGDSFVRISFRLLNEQPTPLKELAPDCPPALIRLVNICLEKSPGDRYASFDEIVAGLTRLIEDSQARPASSYPAHTGPDSGPQAQSSAIQDSAAAPGADSTAQSTVPVGALGSQNSRRPWLVPTLIASLVVLAILVFVVGSGNPWDPGGTTPGAESTVAADTASGVVPEAPANRATSAPAPQTDQAQGTSDSAATESGSEPSSIVPDPVSASQGSQTPKAASPGEPSGSAQLDDRPPNKPGESDAKVAVGSDPSNPQSGPGSATGPASASSTGELVSDPPAKPAATPKASPPATLDPPSQTPPEVLTASETAEPTETATPSTEDEGPSAQASAPRTSDSNERSRSSLEPSSQANETSKVKAPDSGAMNSADSQVAVRVFPQLIEQVQPIYPPRARRKRLEATVTVGVRVDADGTVVRTLVKSSTTQGMGFEEAAKKAAEMSRFRPGTLGGEPAAMWAEIVFQFRRPG